MKLLVLHTGGTIAMSENHQTGTVSLGHSHPMNQVDRLFESFGQIQVENLFGIPSPHMTPDHMKILSRRVDQALDQGYQGVVITHGTDTLEETAYYLELTCQVADKLPIVLTGAMRSSNEIGADGLANLRASLIVAASRESIGQGVLVVMNDEVHTATYVTKTHTTNVATFQTPTFGPVGLVSKNQVQYFQRRPQGNRYVIGDKNPRVVLLKAYAGMDGALIDGLGAAGLDGLVIEALGAGNIPPSCIPPIQRLIERGIPVVFASRAFNGLTYDVYDYPGGGKQMKQMGVLFTNGLSGVKARIKLAVLLSQDRESDFLAQAFHS